MNLEENLISAIRAVESGFACDELAYLALTQKVEHAFRDKLAFVLHQSLDNSRYLVCREWRRADLAIVVEGKPALILEIKAGYTFDILKTRGGYDFRKLVAADLDKAAVLIRKLNLDVTPQVFALVIATHPSTVPHSRYRSAVKYFPGIVRFSDQSNNLEAIRERMSCRMEVFELVDTHATSGGTAYGIDVAIYSWLYRARAAESLINSEKG